ncbi:MAG TPA: serine/threonine-protein kinase [Kofleriaceae bacterium]|nr:serine/threonine-protein kinase [Kofleriaceae bacterium]
MKGSAAVRASEGRAMGKYTLLGRLAQGGMGEILLARMSGAAGFEKYVVIKRLRSHLATDQRSIKAFLEEARIVARISHPNVCQVYELGQEEGRHYLAMEYLEGMPLSGVVRRASRDRAPLDLRAVCGLVEQACEGLHHVHTLRGPDGAAAGVVHRDVSPQNLFVTEDGVVKLLDFGIAKTSDSSVRTPTGRIKGKSAYMSPEQIRGAALDARSDVYAMGVVLYEAVTGQPLFQRGDVHATFRAIREDTLPFLRDIPPEINSIIERAVARDRDDRFSSARALGRAVTDAMSRRGGVMSPAELADWLRERFEPDLEERRARVAQAIAASGEPVRAQDLTPAPVRLETGVVLGGGTVTLTPPSDEVWSESSSPTGEPLARPLPLPPPPPEPLPEPEIEPEREDDVILAVPTLPREVAAPARERRPRRWVMPVGMGAAALVAVAVWSALVSAAGAPSAAGPAVTAPVAAAPVAAAPMPPQPRVREVVLSPDPDVARAIPQAPEEVMTFAPTRAEPAPAPAPAPVHEREKKLVVAERGFLTVDSMPYATIYDGKQKLGVTPLWRVALPAGPHKLVAVTADGRRQTLKVTIDPGKEARRRRLEWP